MVDSAQLSKIVKEAVKGGKFSVGAREAISSMKGTKVIIFVKSLPAPVAAKLRSEAEKHKVAVVEVSLTSAELARLVGKPHRVATLSLRSVGEADLKALTK